MYQISNFEKSKNHMYKFGKIIGILFCIIIIPIIIFNITLIIKSTLNPNEIPDFLGFKSFVIVSKSMEPNIMVGDAIFIKEVNPQTLSVNDIISFKDGNKINTHRIIEIINENNRTFYRTKGDYNKNPDANLVTPDKIEGKYQFRIKGFGFVTEILKSKVTLITLLIIFVLISIYQVKISKRKLKRKQKRYEYEKQKLENKK